MGADDSRRPVTEHEWFIHYDFEDDTDDRQPSLRKHCGAEEAERPQYGPPREATEIYLTD